MCYYNGLRISEEQYISLLEVERQLQQPDLLQPLINGFDYGSIAVIKPSPDCKWNFAAMEWGFIPGWLKNRDAVTDFRLGYKDAVGKFHPPHTTLNAVGEELLTPGKMFREAALKRRCLIVSSGFYEWRHIHPIGKNGKVLKTAIKYPYHITLKNKEYFFMAGIWQPWTDRETGETVDTGAIVTTGANSLMSQIHNSKKRMPVILTDELAGEWISDGLSEERIAGLAISRFPASEMHAYTIQKDFRSSSDPSGAFSYNEIQELDLSSVSHE